MNPSPTPILTLNRTVAKPPVDRVRYFYSGAAALLLVLVFLGFQQFYLHGRAFPNHPLTPPIRTLLISHGIAMTLWVLLLVVQPLLIANGKYRRHMFLGRIGAVLAAGVFILGLSVATSTAKVNPPDLKLWGLDPKQFLAVPIVTIVIFGTYVAIGIWKRRQPDVHRPMMFLSTLVVVSAATARIPFLVDLYRQTIWGTVFGPFFTPLVVGAVLLGVKWALTRSFDRWYATGFAVLVLAGALTMKVAPTNIWDQIASFLLR
jgi:hypothetical protein